MKTVVIIADTHCGSVYGLVPPAYFTKHHEHLQKEAWEWYIALHKKWGSPDVLVVNGDAIEGRQSKQGGAELITPDRNVQIEMAEKCIKVWNSKKVFMTFGTAYHTSEQAEDFEYMLARKVGAKIEGRLFLNIEGLTFDIRHEISTSIIPHGRATALLRELLWDLIKEANDTGPKVDVVVRCLSDDTEILTKRGWMGHSQISKTDEVCTLNKDENKLEWNKINALTTQNKDKKMINIKAKGYDNLITLDHNIIYSPMSSNKYFVKSAEQLSKYSTFKLPVSGMLKRKGVKISDGLLKLLAWVIAEGNMDAGNRSKGFKEKNNVRIYQRESNSNVIEKVLIESGYPYTKNSKKQKGHKIKDPNGKIYETKEDGITFYVRQPYSKKIISLLDGKKNIPDWLMEMDHRQFKLFIVEYIKGDGYLEKNTRLFQGKIFTNNLDLANRIQILFITNGFKAQITPRLKWGKISYIIGFIEKKIITINKRNKPFKVVDYLGLTWCVSVNNETLLVRRNGKASIVGNSHAHYYMWVETPDKVAFITPCLQLARGRFGSRKCSGEVHWGAIRLTVDNGKIIGKDRDICKLISNRQTIIKVR